MEGMGNLFLAGMELFSTGAPINSEGVIGPLEKARKALAGGSPRDRKHLGALEEWVSHNNLRGASVIWDELLKVDYPHHPSFFS